MNRTIFLAGATGAIGRVLAPILVAGGYRVFGSTRRADRVRALERGGVRPVVVDVLDADALAQAVESVRPDLVIHQLTDLPATICPSTMTAAVRRNAALRIAGTRNLVAAALRAGCRRLVAQSVAWVYREGPTPHREDDPLDEPAAGDRRTTLEGVRALESAVLETPGLQGAVLRYGRLHGPGTWHERPPEELPLHVHAAAYAAFLAVENAAAGVYNVVEDDPRVSNAKARQDLQWRPEFRFDRTPAQARAVLEEWPTA